MRRPTLALLLLSLAPALARGQAAPAVAFTVDAGKYLKGAKTPAATAAAIQAAHDEAAANGARLRAIDPTRRDKIAVRVPASAAAYRVDRTTFCDAESIAWDLDGARIAAADDWAGSPFTFGLSRAGAAVDAGYRPDGFGILDAAAAPAPGMRRGFRTRGNALAWAHGTPFSHGGASATYADQPSYWREDRALTLEFLLVGPDAATHPGPGHLFGGATDDPRPYSVGTPGGGTIGLRLALQAARWGPVTLLDYSIALPGPGPRRIALTADLRARSVTGYVDGVQVAVSGPPVPAGLAFAVAEGQTWRVGAGGPNAARPDGNDFALFGPCVARAARYADRGAGKAQVPNPSLGRWGGGTAFLRMTGAPTGGTWRAGYGDDWTGDLAWDVSPADLAAALCALPGIGAGNVTARGTAGQRYDLASPNAGSGGFSFDPTKGRTDGGKLAGCATTDVYRYYPSLNFPDTLCDPEAVAYPRGDDPLGSRTLRVASPGGVRGVDTDLYVLTPGTIDPVAGGYQIRGGSINGGYGSGMAVALCHVLDFRMDGVDLAGGLWALGDLPFGAHYPVRLVDCRAQGLDAAIQQTWSDLRIDRLTVPNHGRNVLRLRGGNLTARDITVGAAGHPMETFATIHTADYGGVHRIEGVSVDNEGVPYSRAGFYVERNALFVTSLTLRSIMFEGMGAGVPTIKLSDTSAAGPPWFWPALLSASEIHVDDASAAAVEADGPGWTGTVSGSLLPGVRSLGTFGPSPIRVMDPTRPGQAMPAVRVVPSAK